MQSVNGEIFVKVQNGFELDELHNVALSSSANNEGLFYDSATSLWKNKTIAAVLGYTPANGANYLPLTGGTLTGDLTLSGTNPRLYFTDTDNNPDYFISNTDGTFTVYDVTNSVGRFKIYSGGNAELTGKVGVGGAAATYSLTAYNSANGTTAAFGGTVYGIRIDNGGTYSSGRSTIFGVDNSFYGTYQPLSIEASVLTLQGVTGGNVLINTTTDAGYKLDVNGSLRVATSLYTTGGTRSIEMRSYAADWNYMRSQGSPLVFGTQDAYNLYIRTSDVDRLIISSTGAATFSSSVTTGGNVIATADGSTGGLRFTLNNTGLNQIQYALVSGGIAGDGNFALRNGSVGSNLMIVTQGGQIRFNNYTSSSSFSGTAAGYLAFDSSGNVITVAGVAATDNTKLPLAGGTMTGALVAAAGDRGFEVNASGGISLYSNEINAGALGGTGTIYLGWRRTSQINVGVPISSNSTIAATGAISTTVAASAWGFLATTSGYSNGSGIWFSTNVGELLLRKADGTLSTRISADGTNAFINNNNILHAGNYNSYSPTLTGGGASGTWGINVTGSSRSLLFSGDSAKAFLDGLWAGGGSYPGYQFTGGNSRFGFSSTSGVIDVYADGNFYATDSSYLVWHAGNLTNLSQLSNGPGYITSSGEINRAYRGIIQDTRSGQRTPNDYDDYRVSWEFTNQIVSGWHSAMTLQGWHDGYAAWQIIGWSDGGTSDNWYLRSGNGTSWGSLRTIIHSGNIGSQSVNYASSAGSTGSLDGYTWGSAGKMVRGSDFYTDGWFRNYNSLSGLYNQTNGNHFYSSSGGAWAVTGAGGNVELQFYSNHQTSLRGFVYGDTSSNFGLLNNQGGWSVRCYPGTGYGGALYGQWDVTGYVNAPTGFISNGNPWGTANSAFFPNGITTAGSRNWIYGATYIGNAPGNGQGVDIGASGNAYFRSNVGTSSHGTSARFLEIQSANGNFIPYSFESEYGNHSWGTVLRIRINQVGADRPSMQFSYAGTDNRWNVGYCYPDDQFRVTQNMAYRNDNSTSDGWGTERFRINTNGDTYAAIGGTLYANGNQVLTYAGGTLSNNYTFRSNLGGYLGSLSSPPLQVYSESNNSAFMSFHKGGYYAVNFGLDADNVMRIGGWSASSNRWQLDMSGNQTVAGDYNGNNYYANGHFRPYGDYGLYSQDYGGVFRRNTNNYGTWESVGYAKNGWGGYVNNNNYIVSWMLNTSGDFGFLTQNGNWWNLFYNNGNNCWGIGTDNTYSGDGFRCIKYGSAQYGWTTWSDRRAKENISTITGALDKVLNMRGVYFNYIIDEAKNKRVGFIAQELQQALPEAVRYAEEIDEYNVEYGQIVSVLAEAVKEHYAKTVAQQIEIEALKTQLQTLLN